MWKKIGLVVVLCLFLFPANIQARTNVTDWYIKNFDSEIVVNKDSSLTITEKITADCGNGVNKHGIFRILPTVHYRTKDEPIYNPISLIAITDFNNNSYKYQESKDSTNNTITWKIGDANKTVTGVNNYLIRYKVENAILFNNEKFDELYWNLNGNFWDLETDKFKAKVIFPTEVNRDETEVNLYSGEYAEKDSGQAKFNWLDTNVIEVESTSMLAKGDGITLSVTTPKNIFTNPNIVMPIVESNPMIEAIAGTLGLAAVGGWIGFSVMMFFVPIIFLLVVIWLWWKHGRDKNPNKTIIAQYDAPNDYSPMEADYIYLVGGFKNSDISANIISLAVRKIVTITETKSKFLFFSSTDYQLTLMPEECKKRVLSHLDKLLLLSLFDVNKVNYADIDSSFANLLTNSNKHTLNFSSLRDKFYKKISILQSTIKTKMESDGMFEAGSNKMQNWLNIVFLLMVFVLGIPILISGPVNWIVWIVCMIIAFFLIRSMTKLTDRGVEAKWHLEGLKLYMNTAEKHRQQFNEKENIFEKFLPYAMMFGMTKQWIGKMKEIYGQNYFDNYHPVWYAGAAGFGSFNADTFSQTMDSMSSNMSSTMSSSPSSSGSSGGGSSGGGGGGGGGGGW